jgi:hypothetical protein
MTEIGTFKRQKKTVKMILKQQHICKMKAERNFYIIQKADTMIF